MTNGRKHDRELEPTDTIVPTDSETNNDHSFHETAQFEKTLLSGSPRANLEESDAGQEAAVSLQEPIPGFRILQELGRGAFGVVYRALDVKLDRQVAIKIPLISDPKLAEKYIKEARNAAKIETGGVVPVFQVGTTEKGQPFVVQKLIDGHTLSTLLKENGTIQVGQAVNYMLKVATAIQGAHQTGLVHRDLKPANILVDANNEPWVADFGLAVFEEDQAALRGEVAGTPIYMSPEQLSGRADWLDGRTDIWSMGVILYELISGKPPFEGKNFPELKEQILNRHPRPLSQRISGAPAEVDEIFRKCCAKDVTARYASAAEMASDLEHLLMNTSMSIGDTPRVASDTRSRAFGTATLRASQAGPATMAQTIRAQGNVWLPIAVACVALVSSLIGLAAIFSTGNGDVDPNIPPIVVNPNENDDPPEEKPVVVPEKIRVSRTGEGTHTTIAAALADAEPDEEIKIQPGIYRENLVITKNVQLVGEGARDDVSIVGNQQAALTLKNGSQVVLTNLTVDAKFTPIEIPDTEDQEAAAADASASPEQESSDKDDKDKAENAEPPPQGINTIEVQEGSSLQVNSCRLVSSSYDCIKAHKGTQLAVLGSCELQSAEHPAIVAQQVKNLRLEGCRFSVKLAREGVTRDMPVAGVELTECSGMIKGCKFYGIEKFGKGISAADCTETLTIADCEFSGMRHAIELFNCKSVEIIQKNVISSCELGVYAEQSGGNLFGLEVSSCDYGLVMLSNSSFTALNTSIEKSKIVGVRLEDSSFDMQGSCDVSNNSAIGIFVDDQRPPGSSSGNAALQATSCTLLTNGIAVLLVAGRINFDQGRISGNTSGGIVVASHEQLQAALSKRSSTNAVRRTITANELTINGKPKAAAVLFNAVGSYHFDKCAFLDIDNNNRPGLSGDLTTKTRGNVTDVVLRDGGAQ